MPHINHLIELDYKPTFRSEKVASMFDVPVQDKLFKAWDINIPIEQKPWQIGLIVGASGSGKTTIASQLFNQPPEKIFHTGFSWPSSCLLDDFPESATVEEITGLLSRVGFSSPPQWLLPYSALSNGQKFRVELARCLLEYPGLFVFDEFTSVVDRQVAKVGAYAFQKAIRKTSKQFVAVTCHYDVEQWLAPDWVLDVSSGAFKWGSLRRPAIKLELCRVTPQAWGLFKEHHYLSADLRPASLCFCAFLEGRPIAFDAWTVHFGKSKSDKKHIRLHRRVVLPDFQGLGIGYKMGLILASMLKSLGYTPRTKTAHPAEVGRLVNDKKNWKIINFGRGLQNRNDRGNKTRTINRLTLTAEYAGPIMEIDEARKLLDA